MSKMLALLTLVLLFAFAAPPADAALRSIFTPYPNLTPPPPPPSPPGGSGGLRPSQFGF